MNMPISPSSLNDLEYRKSAITGIHQSGWREEWRWNGALHSFDDHPAVIINNGEEEQWYKYGLRHRDENIGPAWIKHKNNIQSYYKLDQVHRINGPAITTPAEFKWYRYNKLHREDGPAVERRSPGGFIIVSPPRYEWWWDGVYFDDIDQWGEESNVDPELFILVKLKYG